VPAGCTMIFMEERTVFLFGQSMLLSLVANSLAQSKNLRVMHATNWEEVESLVSECTPDVLIYDPVSASESHILPLLFKNPHLLLIGLDVETNRAVLLTGKESRTLTLERVKEIIESNEAL
jgi:hypothetical protein